MSETSPKYDNEIDLIEMLATLWNGRWVISAFATLAALIGFGYSQIAQPQYYVSASYTINIHSVIASQICGVNIRCMDEVARKRLLSLSKEDGWSILSLSKEDGWSTEKETFSLMTTKPLQASEYEAQIEKVAISYTNEVYEVAKSELALIQTEMTDALLSTERVATNKLNALRTVNSIDGGQSGVTLSSVSIVKTSPKVPRIVVISMALGGMVGVTFMFALKYRKKSLTEA